MKIKNINPVERYFEKVTLVIAAVGVCYFLFYGNYFDEPNVINGVEPGHVEEVITRALTTVDNQKKSQDPVEVVEGAAVMPGNKHAKPVVLPNWVEEYISFRSVPLSAKLLAGVPTMAPPQAPVTPGGGPPPPRPELIIQLPEIAALTDPDISSDRMLVMKAPRPGVAAVPEDITYIKGKITLPLADLRASFAVDPAKYPIYAPHQTAISRIHVQRQERLSDGTWSDWADVPPLPVNVPPQFNLDGIKDDKEIWDRVSQLRARVLEIIHPAFYPAATIVPEANPIQVPTPAPLPGTPGQVEQLRRHHPW